MLDNIIAQYDTLWNLSDPHCISECQKITLNAELQALKLWKAETELERAASEAATGTDKRDSEESTG